MIGSFGGEGGNRFLLMGLKMYHLKRATMKKMVATANQNKGSIMKKLITFL